jgi:16S rRNA (cytidine1402-2'-O)-methyltransferase
MIVVTRELTKLHEETIRGTLADIDIGEPRGEYVFVLEGAAAPDAVTDDEVARRLREEIAQGASKRDAAAAVARRTGRRRREVYEIALTVDGDGDRGREYRS